MVNQRTALEMLRKLEWCGTAYFSYGRTEWMCSICEGLKEDEKMNSLQTEKGGHKSDCRLKHLIDQLEKEVSK